MDIYSERYHLLLSKRGEVVDLYKVNHGSWYWLAIPGDLMGKGWNPTEKDFDNTPSFLREEI